MIQDRVKTEESLGKPECLRSIYLPGYLFALTENPFRFCYKKRIIEGFFQPLLGDKERKRR